MAAKWKHKRYFKVKEGSWNGSAWTYVNYVTFSSTSDANTKIGFKTAYNTSSPTKTESLEDSGQTLVVTYEFGSEADQTAFKSAVDGEYGSDAEPWNAPDNNHQVEHFKTEWLHSDGSISATTNL